MPTILRINGFKFYFYSHEPNEPAHVHVDKGGRSAKFWLSPISLAQNLGFPPHELRQVEHLIEQHGFFLLEKWNEHFNV